ncbi:cytosine permease [Facklamia sp. DSM 111019]|nr:cytosine permease [Facklamia lactis]
MILENYDVSPEISQNVDKDILPTEERIMDNVSYLFSFLGGCVSVGTFSMGASLIGTLTIMQAILAMMIGCLVIAIGLALVGVAGHKYGIPFTIQLRSTFGTTGIKFPGALRGIPAIVWFGFQSWIGAAAINQSLDILFGFSNLPLVFGAFVLLQVLLAIKGFKGIKWLENISAVFIIITLAYMLWVTVTTYSVEIKDAFSDIKGTWGMPFWAATTSFLGIYSTMIINSSDYTRQLDRNTKAKSQVGIYTAAILPVTLFMGMIGLLVSAATGNSDPVAVFSSTLNNKFLTVITLFFIAFAQVSTNVLNNIVPPSYILMEAFHVKWVPATFIVGVLSIIVMPWKLVTSETAELLGLFTRFYSAFLGPIFSVMVVDYFILRKQKLDVNMYYDKNGPFKGVNWAGVIAVILGSAVSFNLLDMSWYVSILPTAVAYYFLMKYMKSAEKFRVGTIFE